MGGDLIRFAPRFTGPGKPARAYRGSARRTRCVSGRRRSSSRYPCQRDAPEWFFGHEAHQRDQPFRIRRGGLQNPDGVFQRGAEFRLRVRQRVQEGRPARRPIARQVREFVYFGKPQRKRTECLFDVRGDPADSRIHGGERRHVACRRQILAGLSRRANGLARGQIPPTSLQGIIIRISGGRQGAAHFLSETGKQQAVRPGNFLAVQNTQQRGRRMRLLQIVDLPRDKEDQGQAKITGASAGQFKRGEQAGAHFEVEAGKRDVAQIHLERIAAGATAKIRGNKRPERGITRVERPQNTLPADGVMENGQDPFPAPRRTSPPQSFQPVPAVPAQRHPGAGHVGQRCQGQHDPPDLSWRSCASPSPPMRGLLLPRVMRAALLQDRAPTGYTEAVPRLR